MDRNVGYVVYRHVQEPRGRVTLLIDILTDPDDEDGFSTLLRWIDREARQADSDKIRTFATHAVFRRLLRRSGYFQVKSTMEFVVKVNGIDVGPEFYEDTDRGTSRWATRTRTDERSTVSDATLLVGIDTEGDNQWDAAARAQPAVRETSTRCRGCMRSFARHGVRPTYVVTYPVASDARSADVLRALLAGGDCEIGAHHHAWETPPCTAEDVRRHPYASTLPRRAVRGAAGVADRRHRRRRRRRAGVVPIGPLRVLGRPRRRLERLGYLVESSVAPLFYEAHKGGPDFVEAPLTPYFLAYDSATRPGHERCARSARVGGARTGVCRSAAVCLRARAAPVHDQTSAPGAGHRSGCDGCGPRTRRSTDMVALARDLAARRRAGPEPPVPFERSHRRRQPVQPDAGGARRVLRAARAVLCVLRDRSLAPVPRDVRRIQARVHAPRPVR